MGSYSESRGYNFNYIIAAAVRNKNSSYSWAGEKCTKIFVNDF